MANTDLNYTLALNDKGFKFGMLGAQKETAKLDGGLGKIGSTLEKIGKAYLAFKAIVATVDFAKNIVLATAAMASFQNAVIASSRTQGEGQANLAFLNREVDRLGLNLEAAQKGYKTFAGAVIGSNIQGAKSNKIFRQVSEAATVLGLSAEQTEASFLALGQMISKGTVQAEELRGQLAERIPGAFQIGARAMGLSTKELGDKMKAGLISSEDFLQKFGDELERTFGGKLGAATNSLTSNLNRLGNEWTRLQANIGESQTGIISSTLSWTNSVLKNFNEVIANANKVDKAFKMAGLSGYSWIERFNDFGFNGSTNKFINDYFTGGKGRDEALQRAIQSNFVDPSSRSKTDALGSESGLLKLSSSFGKAFANKEIGKREYDTAQALFKQALLEIRGNQTLNDLSGSKKSGEVNGSTISNSMGSPVDVSGPRAQNVTINVNHLVENININNPQTAVSGANDAKNQLLKPLLELLNDANAIANR